MRGQEDEKWCRSRFSHDKKRLETVTLSFGKRTLEKLTLFSRTSKQVSFPKSLLHLPPLPNPSSYLPPICFFALLYSIVNSSLLLSRLRATHGAHQCIFRSVSMIRKQCSPFLSCSAVDPYRRHCFVSESITAVPSILLISFTVLASSFSCRRFENDYIFSLFLLCPCFFHYLRLCLFYLTFLSTPVPLIRFSVVA